jgi:putative mRNA 3-end processing factor
MKRVRLVRKDSERMNAIRNKAIIITTSGMLTGGPVMHYLKYLYNDPRSSILITGYQSEHTNGRLLLDKKQVYIDGLRKNVKCMVQQFDFSAHSGMSQLKALVRMAEPKKVFFVHGEEHSVIALQEWAEALGMEAHSPKVGDVIDV